LTPPGASIVSTWPSGKALGCNPSYAGPNPAVDSNSIPTALDQPRTLRGVAEMVSAYGMTAPPRLQQLSSASSSVQESACLTSRASGERSPPCGPFAPVMELVDMTGSDPVAERREGSTPSSGHHFKPDRCRQRHPCFVIRGARCKSVVRLQLHPRVVQLVGRAPVKGRI
jgi:hypothetical protein